MKTGKQDRRHDAGHVQSRKDLVFCTRTGTALSAGNVRRDFR